MQYDVAGILLAGGQGQRMNWELPKQFIRIAGKSILEHSFEALSSPLNHSLIVVTVPSEYVSLAEKILGQYKNAKVIVGGNSRQSSTRAALSRSAQFVNKKNRPVWISATVIASTVISPRTN